MRRQDGGGGRGAPTMRAASGAPGGAAPGQQASQICRMRRARSGAGLASLLIALAVASPKRMEELPDVPTLKEAGADVDAVLWSGLFAPKGTPPEIVKKLENEIIRIARLPDVIARLKPLGILAVGNSSDEFARILGADIARWDDVAKAGNIKIAQ